jgi:hypothetical protein
MLTRDKLWEQIFLLLKQREQGGVFKVKIARKINEKRARETKLYGKERLSSWFWWQFVINIVANSLCLLRTVTFL